MKNNTCTNPGIDEDFISLKVHWLLWLRGTANNLEPLMWLYPKLSFQVSPTSEVKTDSGTFQTTELEPQRCFQSSASAATKEDWHWRKGWCSLKRSIEQSPFIKRKRIPVADGWRSLCFRRERALSKINSKSNQRTVPAPAVFNRPQSPTSTWSPTASPTSPLPAHVYYTPAMDEPLALIKKPRKEPEREEEKAKSSVPAQIQVKQQGMNVRKTTWCFSCLAAYRWKNHVSHCGLSVAPGPATTKKCVSHL